jgi:hypothetical protein
VKFVATKKGLTKKFFSSLILSLVTVFGSGIRDPRSGMGKNQDPGSRINIPDPQHCCPQKVFHLMKVHITFCLLSLWYCFYSISEYNNGINFEK